VHRRLSAVNSFFWDKKPRSFAAAQDDNRPIFTQKTLKSKDLDA
jgi:hypothetical protein